jgi:nitrite reductase/ring-hydroxylating ferredoxin subunit
MARYDGPMVTKTGSTAMPIPHGLLAPGTHDRPYTDVTSVDGLPPGTMRRVSFGELDLLVAHVKQGVCVIDDRCPHMAAPLSLGTLEDCVVACPLHSGRFDLRTGGVVQFPTTGGLDADGGYHPPWTPPGAPPKPEPSDLKGRARAATRVRRLRYYPVRIREGIVEARLPALDHDSP